MLQRPPISTLFPYTTLFRSLQQPTRLWAAAADRLFRSDDGGANWQRVGRPLPEPNTTVNGIAASEEAIVLTTDRGLYRSVEDRKSTRLNSSHPSISYAVFCL